MIAGSPLETRPTYCYQPLQSNLNPHFRHLMQPLTFASCCDSPHLGHVVSSAFGSFGAFGSFLASKDDSLAAEEMRRRAHQERGERV